MTQSEVDNWLAEGYRKAWCDACGKPVYFRRLRRGSWHGFQCVLCNSQVDPNMKHSLDRVGEYMRLMEEKR